MKIGMDLGHGVRCDYGAVGIRKEEDCINPVGLLVISKLKQLGHTIVELRPTNAISLDNSLTQRWQKANAENVDLVVSIHFNKTLGGRGTEVYAISEKGKEYAQKIVNEIAKLGYYNRGVKSANFAMLKRTNATAILIEVAFLDSQEDMNRFNTEDISNAIVKGICGQLPIKQELVPTITYQSHIQNIGWQTPVSNGDLCGSEGKGLRMEALTINYNGIGNLIFQGHIQNLGWTNERQNGEIIGTIDKALRLEAVKIKLDNAQNYHVEYQVHVQNKGWMSWVRDGQIAGSIGEELRLEAIKIRIVRD